MESLIPVVNKLQDVFGAIGQQTIDLPQIVVVGSQSAGKSSVLENIVGRDFLPRGTGIVTRRPLVLQLYSMAGVAPGEVVEGSSSNGNIAVSATSSSSSSSSGQQSSNAKQAGDEWGEFLHLPGQRFYDFSEIRAEIQRETERVSGRNKGISNKSINLKIFSPHVLNLTLVDLPGITKIPTGDQPEDVEEQIRSMCFEFISNPNAIILAVTAANGDLVNSDGLKMARSVDPDGERTIGVLTKVDIMDNGTDASDILSNRVVPLRRGYIAVVNRSQKDILDDAPIRQGLGKEATFFQSHPKYRTMLSKCGTHNLARTLNQILMLHIRDCLPEIKSRIMGMMVTVQSNIDSLGESPSTTQGGQLLGATLLQLLSKFATNFGNSIEGRGSGSESAVEMAELYGGARISYIFNEVFGKSLRALDPFEGLDDEDIRTAIANANGPRPSLFVPEIAFDLLVKKQIEKLLQPGLQCVDLVFDEMQRMAYQSEAADLSRFPELRDRVFEIVNQLLRACMQPTQKMICNMIKVELAYINTSHPDFIGGKQAVAQLNRKFNSRDQAQGGGSGTGAADGENRHPNSNGAGGAGSSGDASDVSGASRRLGDELSGEARPRGAAPTGRGFFSVLKANNGSGSSLNSHHHNHHHHHGGGSGSSGGGLGGNSIGSSSGVTGINGLGISTPRGSHDSALVKLPQMPEKMRSGSAPTDRERIETEIIKSLISSYFDIVKKNFMDLVPKTIMHFLVNTFKEGLQNELVKELYKEQIMADLMRETEEVASRRKACKEMKELLQRAMEIVHEVRDFSPCGRAI